MRDIVRRSTVLLTLAAMLFTGVAQAMEIWKFDKMSDEDQKEYVIRLVESAQKVLRDEGKADEAEKVAKLFTTKSADSDVSIGMSKFITNLALARVADLKRVEEDPNAS